MRILAVDDDDLVLRLLSTVLEAHGHTVATVRDARDVIEVSDRFRPDLVFLDIAMPHRDGVSLMGELRASRQGAEIPIYALTASHYSQVQHCVGQGGFTGVLRKPCSMKTLLRLTADTERTAACRPAP
jgi:CheY-like chemotaxis protein